LVEGRASAYSPVWWFIPSGGASLFQAKFNTYRLQRVNGIPGMIVTRFALIALGEKEEELLR